VRCPVVHRTSTVDCPVRPYRVLKKRPPARDRARGSLTPPPAVLSVSLATPSPPPAISLHRRPPSPIGLRRPRVPLLPSSVSRPSPLVLLSLCSGEQRLLFLPFVQKLQILRNLVNPCCGMCVSVCIEYPCRFLAPSGGFSHHK
jgi:hypothetical protein